MVFVWFPNPNKPHNYIRPILYKLKEEMSLEMERGDILYSSEQLL